MTFLMVLCFSSANAQPTVTLADKMRVLKSQLDVLQSQRDLVVINFPMLEAVSENMVEITKDVSWYTLAHAPTIELLQKDIQVLVTEASLRDSNAYTTANDLQNSCLICHSNVSPASGIKWEDLPGLNWAGVVEKCNSNSMHGTNPFTCKNMYGMKTMVNYFTSSHIAENKNFKATAEVAKEIRRISTGLVKANFVHGGKKILKEIAHEAMTIETLAKRLDPRAFGKAQAMSQSCTQCHSL